jgi:hypothetical protein
MDDLDRFVLILLSRLSPSAKSSHLSTYTTLRTPSSFCPDSVTAFARSIPPFLSTLISLSCSDDPLTLTRTASHLFNAALASLRTLPEFPPPAQPLGAAQVDPVNVYRWMRDTIRENAHLERRIAELGRLSAELAAEMETSRGDLQRWQQRVAKGTSGQGRQEKIAARTMGDVYYALQEANRDLPAFLLPPSGHA